MDALDAEAEGGRTDHHGVGLSSGSTRFQSRSSSATSKSNALLKMRDAEMPKRPKGYLDHQNEV